MVACIRAESSKSGPLRVADLMVAQKIRLVLKYLLEGYLVSNGEVSL